MVLAMSNHRATISASESAPRCQAKNIEVQRVGEQLGEEQLQSGGCTTKSVFSPDEPSSDAHEKV
jgi:hypothetical protein